jgi:nicotinamidase-related amidase
MKTLRQWAGLPPTQSIDPATTALLLVDFQREYFDGKLPLPMADGALAAVLPLLRAAERAGMAVVHVHHRAGSHEAPLFAPDSVGAEAVTALMPAPDHLRVVKGLPSSFVGTGLEELLQERGCRTVIVTGLMTHNCVDATARDALHRGFAVLVAGDACGTRDLPGAVGGPYVAAAALHEAVLAGLADRIAEVFSAGQLVTMLAA